MFLLVFVSLVNKLFNKLSEKIQIAVKICQCYYKSLLVSFLLNIQILTNLNMNTYLHQNAKTQQSYFLLQYLIVKVQFFALMYQS